MPKKLTTLAKCGGGVRNPFTRRCVDLDTPAAKYNIQLAHHVNEFKRRLMAAKVPKPDRQLIVDQWKYIARITDTRPQSLPTPAPDQRPPGLDKRSTSTVPRDIYSKTPVFVGRMAAAAAKPVFVHIPSSHGSLATKKQATRKKFGAKGKECEADLKKCKHDLRKTKRRLEDCTAETKTKEEKKKKKAKAPAVKSKQAPAPATKRSMKIADILNKFDESPVAVDMKIEELPPVVIHAAPAPAKKRRIEPVKVMMPMTWDPAFATASGVHMPVSVSSKFPILPDPTMTAPPVAFVVAAAPKKKRPTAASYATMGQQVSQSKFLARLEQAKSHYYGNLGLKSLLPAIKERTVARIDEIIAFMRNPAHYTIKNEIGVATVAAPGFDMKNDTHKREYTIASDNVLNSVRKIREDAARSGAALSEPEIADAADVLAKSSIFTMLVSLLDPVLNEDIEEGEEEGDATYTPVSEIDPNLIVEPITFLIGAGASKDSGIETFVEMSLAAAAQLGRLLEAAWASTPKYSAEEQKAQMDGVDWAGSVRSYFFPAGAPGEQLRHCLTTTAAKYYPTMMVAAWEFMYLGVQDKHPSLTHSIIKALESLRGDTGAPVLANTITMNVDGLEFAAGIDEISIIPAHGSVILKQPIDSGIGEAKASLVKSVEEIRSGRYRPAIVLYGEDVLPSADDMDNVVKDAEGGTLVIVGTSLKTGTGLLENMRVTTTIVVNPDPQTADDTLALIDESADASDVGRGLVVVEGGGDDDEEEFIKGFATANSFALKTPADLAELFDTVYNGFKTVKHPKTVADRNVSSRLLERFNEFVK